MDIPGIVDGAGDTSGVQGADSATSNDGNQPGMVPFVGAGAGMMMGGGTWGTIASLMSTVPDPEPTMAEVREQLETYKQMQTDGLITQEDYDAVKARLLKLLDD